MKFPKKIAALATPIAGIVLLLAVPASAQNAQASTSPKADVNFSTPKSEAPHKKVVATRHSWSKKHTARTAGGTDASLKPKPKVANDRK